MENAIKAFIEFLTALFAALAKFLGYTVPSTDLTTTAEATTLGE